MLYFVSPAPEGVMALTASYMAVCTIANNLDAAGGVTNSRRMISRAI
jgi:hypothetical protein